MKKSNLKSSRLRAFSAAVTVAASISASFRTSLVHGDTLNWDPSTLATSNDPAVAASGGSGIWNGNDLTWFAGGVSDVNWNNTGYAPNFDTAVFGDPGAAGTFTVNLENSDASAANIVAGGLMFSGPTANASTYAIAGPGVLTLSSGFSFAAPVIEVDNTSGPTVISALIAGASGLNKTGDGTLILSGSNNYTGGTTVTTGMLVLQGNAFSTTAQTYTIASGAVLDLDGTTSVASNLTNSPTGPTLITGNGNLLITTGTFAGNVSSTNGLTMAMGTLGVTSPNALINVQAGATFANAGSPNITWTSNLASLQVDATGTFDLSGGNTVIVDALTGGGTISTAATSGTGLLNIGNNNGGGTFTGQILNGLGTTSLTKSGTGHQILTGSNNYSGTTTVNGGILEGQYGGNGTWNSFGTSNIVVNAAGTLQLTNTGTSATFSQIITGSGATILAGGNIVLGTSGSFSSTGDLTVNAGLNVGLQSQTIGALNGSANITGTGPLTLSVGNNGDSGTFSGVIDSSGGAISLIKNGSGTETLSNAGNNIMGTVTVNGGILATTGGNAPVSTLGAASAIVVNNNGTISVGGDNSFVGGNTNGTTTITINSGGVVSSTTGSTNHLDHLILNGGTLSATSSNGSYGSWNFDQGVSTLGNLGSPTTSFISGGNALLSQSGGTVFNIGGTDTLNISSALATVTNGGAGTGLVKSGTGTLVLTGINTYGVGTTISAGTVIAGATLSTGPVSIAGGSFLSTSNATNSGLASLYYNIAPTNVGNSNPNYASFSTLLAHLSGSTPALVAPTTTINFGGTGSGMPGVYGNTTQQNFESFYSGMLTVDKTATYTFNTSSDDGTMLFINGQTVVSNNAFQGVTQRTGTITLNAGVVYNIAVGFYQGTGGYGLNAQISGGNIVGTSDINASNGHFNITPDLVVGSLTGTGNVILSTGNLITGIDNSSPSFGGTISGIGGLTKLGTGTQTLSTPNTFSGTTAVYGGTLSITDPLALQNSPVSPSSGLSLASTAGPNFTFGGLTGSNPFSMVDSASQVINLTLGNTSASYSGAITGTGNLTKAGSGTQILTGSSPAFTGNTQINAGTLQIGDGTNTTAAIANSAITVGASGALAVNLANTGIYSQNVTDNGAVNAVSSFTNTFSGTISGSNGAFNQNGSGTSILKGVYNYGGPTTVNAGTLQIGDGVASNVSLGASAVTVNVGGTLAINILPGETFANNVAVYGTMTDIVPSGTNTLSGMISGNGSIVQSGAGTTSLTNANSTFTGTYMVNAGTLVLANGQALSGGTINGAFNFGPGVTNFTVGGITGSGNINLVDSSSQGVNLTVGGNNAPLAVYTGVLSDNGVAAGQHGSLTKTGSGILFLGNSNTYSGKTFITQGTIQLGTPGLSEALLGNGTNGNDVNYTTSTWGTTTLVSTARWGAINVPQNSNLTPINVYTGAHGPVFGDNTTFGYGGYIDNTTSGSLTYTFAKNFDDNAYVKIDGTVVLANGSYNTPAMGSISLLPGLHSIEVLFGEGGGGVGPNIGGGTVTASNPSGFAFGGYGVSYTTDSVVPGAASSDWLQVGPASSNTLFVALTGGGQQLPSGTQVVMSTNTTLITGGPATIGSLIDAAGSPTGAQVQIGSSTLTIGGDNLSTTFSGAIAGVGGSLIKNGSGTFTTTGTNTYSGGTIINGGILAGTSTSLQGNILVNANTTLAFDQTLPITPISSGTYAGVITGGGNVVKNNAGSVTLASDSSYTGGTTINGGTLVAGGRALSTGLVTVAPGGTLSVSRPAPTANTGVGLAAMYFDGTIPADFGNNGGVLPYGRFQGEANAFTTPFTITQLATGVNNLNNGGGQFPGKYVSGQSNFAAFYSGMINITSGNSAYTFETGSDDGSNLYIDGNLIVNNNYNQGVTYRNGTISNLTPGEHNIAITYFQGGGGYGVDAEYKGADTGGAFVEIGAATAPITPDLILNSLTGSGNIALTTGSLITGLDNSSTAFSGAISGAGAVNKWGIGTLTLTGSNAYTGGNVIAGGTLAGTTASIVGNVADYGNLILDGTLATPTITSGTFAGNISGTGTLAKNGVGTTVTLTGVDTYSGATTINAGTLALQNTVGFVSPISVGANGTLNIINTATGFGSRASIAGNAISGSGIININNAPGSGGLSGGWVYASTASALNFTGTLNINSGVFGTDGVGSAGVIAGSATVNIASGAVFTIHSSSSVTIGGLNGAGDVTPAQVGGGTYNLTLGAGDQSGSFSGVLHGNNSTGGTDGTMEAGFLSLTKTGLGTQILSGTNTYTGATSVNGGILEIGASGSAGSLASGNYGGGISIGATGTLEFSSTAAQTLTGVISGSGNLQMNASGSTLTLSNGGNANTFTGTVTVNAGTLVTNANNFATGSLGNATSIVVNSGGTISVGGNNSLVGSTTSAATTITINAGGVITNTTGATIQLDALTLNGGTLSATTANPTYGNWNFNYGVQTAGNGNTSTISGGNATLTQVGGTVFNVQGSDVLNVSTALAQTTSIAGTGLIKNGIGVLSLSSNNSYAGGTTINGGTVFSTGGVGSGPLSITAGTLNVASATGLAGVYFSDGGTSPTLSNFASYSAFLTHASSTTPALVLPTASMNFGSNGAGFPGINGNNNFEGFYSGMVNITTPGTYTFNTSSDDGSMLFIDGQTVVNNNFSQGVTTRSGALSLSAGEHNIVIGYWQGGGGFGMDAQMSGAGNTTMVDITSANVTPDLVVGSISGSPGTSIVLGNGNLITGTDGTAQNFGGTISGPGGLTKFGAGAQTLSGTNTFSGNTTVFGGSLVLTTPLALENSTVNPAGVVLDQAAGGAFTFGGLTGSSTLALLDNGSNPVTLTVGNNEPSTYTATYSGALTNAGGSLIKIGSGTQILSGSNSYNGTTQINGGTLQIGDGVTTTTSLGASTINVGSAGTLVVDLANNGSLPNAIVNSGVVNSTPALNVTQTLAGNITGGGPSFNQAGAGTTILTGTNGYTGNTNITAGTLQIGGGASLGSGNYAGAIAISPGAVFQSNSTTDQILSGPISGGGAFNQSGSNTTTLGGSNTSFTGPTTVTNGTLQVGNTNALVASNVNITGGSITFSPALTTAAFNSLTGTSPATVNLSSTTGVNLSVGAGVSSPNISSFSGTLTGNGSLTKQGTGTLFLGNTGNSYSGTTYIKSGTIQLGTPGLTEWLVANGTNGFDQTTAYSPSINASSQSLQQLARWGKSNNAVDAQIDDSYSTNSSSPYQTLTWGRNTTWGYAGYLDNTTSSTVVYYFGFSFDDNASIKIDGTPAFTSQAWGTEGSVSVAPGVHTLDLRFGNGAGGAGPQNSGNGNFGGFGLAYNTTGFTSPWLQIGADTPGTLFLAAGGGGQQLPVGTPVVMFTATTLISGSSLTIGSLADASDVVGANTATLNIGSGTLTLGTDNTSPAFSGNITGAAGIDKVGSGVQTLSGSSAYTGTTEVDGTGTLQFVNSAPLSSSALITGPTGTLEFNNTSGVALGSAVATTISGSGTFLKTGGGTLTLGGAHTVTLGMTGGLIDIEGGTVQNVSTVWTNNVASLTVNNALFDMQAGGSVIVDALNGNGTIDQTVGGATQTLTVGANGGSGVFTGIIQNTSGSLGLTKTGSGTQALTNANTYTGNTTVSAGTLQLANSLAVQNSTVVDTVANGGIAFTSAGHGTFTFGGLSGTGNINLQDNTSAGVNLTVGNNNTPLTGFVGNLTDGGTGATLTKIGTGVQLIGGANSYSGNTYITGGTLKISAPGLTEGLVNNNNAFDTTTAFANWTVTPSSATSLSVQATARWGASNATGNNTFPNWSGNTTWGYSGYIDNTSGGSVVYTFGKNFDDSAYLNIDGSIVISDSQWNVNTVKSITLAPGLHTVDLRFGQGGGGVGPNTGAFGNYGVSYNTGSNTSTGNGIGGNQTWLPLGMNTAANTAFMANSGLLGNSAIPATSSVIMSTGTTFDATDTTLTIGSLTDAIGATGQHVLLGNGTLTVGNDGTSPTFSGGISGTGGSLVKIGSGTQTLAGSSTYTGSTTISGGTLIIPSTGSITGNSTVSNSALSTLTIAGTVSGGTVANAGALNLSSTGSLTGTTAINNASTGVLSDAGTVVGGTISNVGNLDVALNASLTGTTAFNTTSGGITTIEGTVTVGNNGQFGIGSGSSGTGTVIVNSTGILNIGNNGTGNAAATYIGGLINNIGTLGTGTLTINGGTVNVGAPGSGSSTNGNASALYLNPYGGTGSVININNGGLLSSARPIINGNGGGTATLNINGGTLQSTASINVNTAVALGASGATFDSDGNTLTISTGITDGGSNGGLTKIGLGTLVLTATNTYNGTTTINAGTLQLNVGGQNNSTLAGSGAIVINNGGTLLGNATDGLGYFNNSSTNGITINEGGILSVTTNNRLSMDRNVTSVGGTITSQAAPFNSNASYTMRDGNGAIDNFTSAADGTPSTISAVQFGLNGNVTFNVAQGINSTTSQPNAVDLNVSGSVVDNFGGGTLIKAGTGVMSLTGTNTYSGGTTITGGTLQGTTLGIQGNVNNGASLIFNQSLAASTTGVAGTYGGSISGNGSVTKNGNETVSFTGSNSYHGGTTINAGTLALAASSTNNISSSSAITIAGAATLDVTGLNSGAIVLGAGQNLVAPGTGTATVSGSVTAGSNTLNLQDGTNIGTLAISNNLNLTGSTLKFDLGNTSSDQITIGSAASLSGTETINVAALASATSLTLGNQAYTLLTAGSGLSNSNFALSSSTLTVGGHTYTLSLNGNGTDEYLGVTLPVQTFTYATPGSTLNARPSSTIGLSGTLSNGGAGTNLVVNLASTGTLSVTGLGFTSNPVLGVGSATITGTINTGTLAGAQGWTVTNSDNNATSSPASIAGTVNVFNYANPTYTGTTLALGNVRVGATAPTASLSIANTTVTSASFQDNLTAGATTSNGFVTAAGFSELAAGSSGNLVFSGSTAAAGSLASTATLSLNSTATVSGLDPKVLTPGGGTVTTTGGVYDYANPTYTGTVLSLGNIRVGAAAPVANLGVANTTITNASFQDNLTAGATTNNAFVTATGFSELSAGSSGNLAFNGNTSTAGSLASTATLSLNSTNTVSGLDAKVLTPSGGTVTTTGGVYDYANPTYAGTTLSLGNVRVGATAPTANLSIANTTITSASFQDNLAASATTNNGGVTATGFAQQAAGTSGNLVFSGSTATAGTLASTATLSLTSTNLVSGLDVKPLTPGGGTVATTGGVYDYANATYSGGTLAFGNVHEGASVASQTVAFGNQTVTNANFQDLLDVSATTGNSLVTATGFTGLAASTGGTASNTLSFSVNTAAAGSLASTSALTLTSNANGVAGLTNGVATVVGSPTAIATTGQVYSGQMVWNGADGDGWNTSPNADWNDSTNSSVHVAPGLDTGFTGVDSATFGNTSGSVTVNLNGSAPNLNALAFNGTGTYTIAPGSSGSLTLAGTNPSVTVSSGTQTISAPITLGANLTLTPAASSTLALSGNINEIGGGRSITANGAGTVILSGNNTYSSGTSVNSGILLANTIAATGTSSTGSGPVIVGTGGILGGGAGGTPTNSLAGLIGGSVTINSGATSAGSIAPGIPLTPSAARGLWVNGDGNTGTLAIAGDLTLQGPSPATPVGGTYFWKADFATNVQDQITVAGNIDVLSSPADPFNLVVEEIGQAVTKPTSVSYIIAQATGAASSITIDGTAYTHGSGLTAVTADFIVADNTGLTADYTQWQVNVVPDSATGGVDLQVTGTVPEPGSLGLLGIASLGLLRRRRTNRRNPGN